MASTDHECPCAAAIDAAKKLYGNGTPGLLSDMRIVQEKVEQQKVTLTDVEIRIRRLERSLWIAVGVISAFQALLKYVG